MIRNEKQYKAQLESNLRKIPKIIEGTHVFYTMLKIIEVKKKIYKQKTTNKALKNFLNSEFVKIIGFGEKILEKVQQKYTTESQALKDHLRKFRNGEIANFSYYDKESHRENLKNFKDKVNKIARLIPSSNQGITKSIRLITLGNSFSGAIQVINIIKVRIQNFLMRKDLKKLKL